MKYTLSSGGSPGHAAAGGWTATQTALALRSSKLLFWLSLLNLKQVYLMLGRLNLNKSKVILF